MAYASRSGRANLSGAFAVCDRCGFTYNHKDLHFQYDWRGAALQNIKLLVCNSCTDVPQQQLRAIVLPADPAPIMNARVPDYVNMETNFHTLTAAPTIDPKTGLPVYANVTLATEDGKLMTEQPIGNPLGLIQNVQYGDYIDVLSVISNGTTIVSVTCNGVHGLVDNDQISVEGLADNSANGFFSITILSATAFTYQTNEAINSASLLTGTSNIIKVLVGLPLGYTQIPQTGV